ncbi:MAG TPA: hypothetical protein VJ377_00480 [Dehalococcoidales bacterium]|nr:MAG: hypothetical protein A2Z05_06015 [Chloroflexi bacterium RBG_16_60_22]HJX11982.1 hypothetical protein [Dehalococcoidales bacterium]
MRQLTSTLLAAQQQASGTPYVKVEVKNRVAGVVRYDWSRLYAGSEVSSPHAVAMPSDGSIVRVRATPMDDGRKIYRQRVAGPGPGSDFSQWTYINQYNALVVAAASLGAEVSIFWIKTNREIRRIKSTDYGVTWGSPELIDYSSTTSVYGLAAAYKPNGDLAIFFADQVNIFVKKYIGGVWQAMSAWDKTTDDLSGVGCCYGTDWNLLVTGKDAPGNFKLWSLVYGDGGDVSAGSWSALREMASAPSGGDFEYRQPFLDMTDVWRCFFVEKFAGTEAYERPFWSHTVVGADFVDGLWREPVPFDMTAGYGLAMAHHGDYAWLSSPDSVWRADLTARTLDMTADVVGIRQETGETEGSLTVALRNDDGRYAAPGEGSLADLVAGAQLDFGPGYVTTEGGEVSSGQSFSLEAFEHTSGGRAGLVLHARDGWGALADWRARHQFRWNRTSDDLPVRDIIAFVLARVGLNLEVVSASSAATGFYPDFTINPDNDGRSVIRTLLSFVPDVLFLEGNQAYLVNPLAADSPVYSYGGAHPLREGRYRRGAMAVNRVQVEGYDAGSGEMVLADSFDWDEIGRLHDRLRQVEDRNIATVNEAQQRGQSVLRKMEIAARGSSILVPVNCGQQLYDVIDITDAPAGLDGEKMRVLGLALAYQPPQGEYRQRLWLGAV